MSHSPDQDPAVSEDGHEIRPTIDEVYTLNESISDLARTEVENGNGRDTRTVSNEQGEVFTINTPIFKEPAGDSGITTLRAAIYSFAPQIMHTSTGRLVRERLEWTIIVPDKDLLGIVDDPDYSLAIVRKLVPVNSQGLPDPRPGHKEFVDQNTQLVNWPDRRIFETIKRAYDHLATTSPQ